MATSIVFLILLLFCFTLVIFADESTEKSPTEDEKTEKQPTEPEDDVDVSVQPIEKKNNKKKNKPKDKEEVTPKKPQLEFPNFPPFSQWNPEFYYPSLKPDFIPPGSYYNPFSSYPSLSPRFGGQFPGIPILLPEMPTKKDKPSSKDKNKKSEGDSSEKDESEELEGSGKEEEESDKEDNKEDKEDSKPDNGKPKISIIRVLQLPYLPVLRSPPFWVPPRVDTIPLDPISNTISFDGFGPRIGNPWYNGPFLGRSFAPQYILRR